MVLRTLFPTLVAEESLGDEALRAALERVVWLLADEDVAGNAWCEREGYAGYTSYASLDDLPQRFPEIADLKTHLDVAAARFAEMLHWDLAEHRLVLDAIWVNVLGEGGNHSGHIHPGSVISGTYYVRVPDGAGALRFEDPRLGFMMAAPLPRDDAPEAARRFIYLSPKEGQALLWEGWLRHEVMPNMSETERLSISFNYALERR